MGTVLLCIYLCVSCGLSVSMCLSVCTCVCLCLYMGVWHVNCLCACPFLCLCVLLCLVCDCVGSRTEGAVHSFRDTVFIFRQNILLRYSPSLLSGPRSVSVRQSHYPLLSWLPSSQLSTSLGPVGKLKPRGQGSKFIYYLSQLYLVSLAPRMVSLSNEPDVTPKWSYKLSISIAANL